MMIIPAKFTIVKIPADFSIRQKSVKAFFYLRS